MKSWNIVKPESNHRVYLVNREDGEIINISYLGGRGAEIAANMVLAVAYEGDVDVLGFEDLRLGLFDDDLAALIEECEDGTLLVDDSGWYDAREIAMVTCIAEINAVSNWEELCRAALSCEDVVDVLFDVPCLEIEVALSALDGRGQTVRVWSESHTDHAHCASTINDLDAVGSLLCEDAAQKAHRVETTVLFELDGETRMIISDDWSWERERKFAEGVYGRMAEKAGVDSYCDDYEWLNYIDYSPASRLDLRKDIDFVLMRLKPDYLMDADNYERVAPALKWAREMTEPQPFDGRFLRFVER